MKTKTKILGAFILMSFILEQTVMVGQGVGEAAPDFTLSTIGGGQFNLASNSGKVVFIFLFGYGCPHCLANGNNTETGIYSEFKDNSEFVAIGVDTWDGNESGVQNFINETGITYPVAITGSGLLSSYSTTYDRIIVVDKQGIIKYKATANATASVVEDAKKVIQGLLTSTAVNDIKTKSNSFKVYPVPAKEMLYLDGNLYLNQETIINIINLHGKTVFSTSGSNSSGSTFGIPVKSLSSGVYVLQIINAGQEQSKRIMISQ